MITIDKNPLICVPNIIDSDANSKLFVAIINDEYDTWIYFHHKMFDYAYNRESYVWEGINCINIEHWNSHIHMWSESEAPTIVLLLRESFLSRYTTKIFRLDNYSDVYNFFQIVMSEYSIRVPDRLIVYAISLLQDRSNFL